MTEQLSQLELEAAAIDNDMAANEFKQPEAVKAPSLNADYKPMIIKALGVPVGFIDTKIDFTKKCFDEAAISDIADAFINVADIEQWDLKKIFGDTETRTGAWVALAIAVLMPSVMFYMAWQDLVKNQPKTPQEKEVKAAEAEQPTSFHG